jgi:hypothetical protein
MVRTMATTQGRVAPPLERVAGVPECTLSAALAARLPEVSAPAPWETTLHAVVWMHRATADAVRQLPEPLRAQRTLPVTVGAFVRYLDTPVGPYSEILASPVMLARAPLPAASVPFIAVDSLASLHGGRANWSLPKTLAEFAWTETPEDLGSGPFAVRGEGADGPSAWSVTADVTPGRVRLPLRLPLRDVQLTPDGRELVIAVAVRARAQMATVDVRTDGPTLPSWLLTGRHRGFVLPRAQMTFAAPR